MWLRSPFPISFLLQFQYFSQWRLHLSRSRTITRFRCRRLTIATEVSRDKRFKGKMYLALYWTVRHVATIFGRVWEVLKTFLKLLVGNFPGTFGWKLSRNFWLESFEKLLVGNFYYWLETSRNFWEVLKTFLKISRNFWLETFQKLLVGNFPET